MIKNTFAIYINNYDDIEFNQKVRKVQDADRMQLNVNNEQDLINLANPGGSPSGSNTNFFNTENTRARRNSQPLSSFGGAQRDRADIALGGMHFSDDGENQTQSLNDTQFVEELQEQIENINGQQNFEYGATVSTSEKKSEKKDKRTQKTRSAADTSDNQITQMSEEQLRLGSSELDLAENDGSIHLDNFQHSDYIGNDNHNELQEVFELNHSITQQFIKFQQGPVKQVGTKIQAKKKKPLSNIGQPFFKHNFKAKIQSNKPILPIQKNMRPNTAKIEMSQNFNSQSPNKIKNSLEEVANSVNQQQKLILQSQTIEIRDSSCMKSERSEQSHLLKKAEGAVPHQESEDGSLLIAQRTKNNRSLLRNIIRNTGFSKQKDKEKTSQSKRLSQNSREKVPQNGCQLELTQGNLINSKSDISSQDISCNEISRRKLIDLKEKDRKSLMKKNEKISPN